MRETAAFERRTTRPEQVVVRVSASERIELERLARQQKASLSDILRDGLAHVRRLHAQDTEAKDRGGLTCQA